MNFNNIIFLDFETGSRNPHKTQPIQLAAVVIDGRKLEIHEEFMSYIRPELDLEKCKLLEIDPIEDEALKINKKKLSDFIDAPSPKTVWDNFIQFVNRYNSKKNDWTAPIMAGANIIGFDDVIINRLAFNYGEWDKDERRCTLFNKIHKLDLLHDFFRWFENKYSIKSLSMNSMRELIGISKTDAHDALQDCRDGANILIRFINLYRKISPTVRFRPKQEPLIQLPEGVSEETSKLI